MSGVHRSVATVSVPPGYDLTARAREVLIYLSTRDTCPTYQEISDALGLAGRGNVHRIICLLERRGYIRRRPRCPLSITVLRPLMPSAVEQPSSGGTRALPLLGPVPAPWSYPFRDHRTVAQVWADEEKRAA